MKLLKPSWVSHGGKPLFSVDIHPDGSRFATGGQGDNSGKVVIWNLAPVRSETDEKDSSVPKILCQMENHLACVNSVKWSVSGRYLASGGDDKLIMIWQISKYGSGSSVFGTGGKVEIIEQWKCTNTLRGHSGDVLDLAWSMQDNWLASCSVDNTIIIWNACKFPEITATLKGHNGLVKGLTWDPIGKYLASQSDDKSLRFWRTKDWKHEVSITKPFVECGGTTHVLRLSWSPDGAYIVSAHAMNNAGPTAQIIERTNWRTNLDFVGHRKAVTVTKFNPHIFSKALKAGVARNQQYSCCAIGSRDRSLSIWLTALKRPLVVIHDLFENSVLDISWSTDGYEMLVCSFDGTCAYIQLDEKELGNRLTPEEQDKLYKKMYGKTLQSMVNQGKEPKTMIIENPQTLLLQERKKEEKEKQKLSAESTNSSQDLHPVLPYAGCPTDKQIETRTPDGRRRITPLFIAPQADLSTSPLPFSSKKVFSSSTEQKSQIVIEKKGEVAVAKPASSETPTDAASVTKEKVTTTTELSKVQAAKAKDALGARMVTSSAEKSVIEQPESQPVKQSSTLTVASIPIKRKLESSRLTTQKRQRKDKDDVGSPVAIPTSTTLSDAGEHLYVASSSSMQLPVPKARQILHSCVSKTSTEEEILVTVENNMLATGPAVHVVRYCLDKKPIWEAAISSQCIILCSSRNLVCCGCEDRSLVLFSSSGRRLLPSIILSAPLSLLKCNKYYVMAVTSDGFLHVWDMKTMNAVLANVSLLSVIPCMNLTIEGAGISASGVPMISLSSGVSYMYGKSMKCWLQVSSKDDPLQSCARQSGLTLLSNATGNGPLQQLHTMLRRSGREMANFHKARLSAQQISVVSHLENLLAAAYVLESPSEYKECLTGYVRYLAQEGFETRLREICDMLLGPTYKTTSEWNPAILGMQKRLLLMEFLPLIGSNLELERLFLEYQTRLKSIKNST